MYRAFMLALCVTLMGCPPPLIDNPDSLPSFNAGLRPAASVNSGVAVAIVIDTSGSMNGDKMQAVKTIVTTSIVPRMSLYASEHELDVAIVKCGRKAAVLRQMDDFDEQSFSTTINDLHAEGGTPLAASMILALQELAQTNLEERHVFVLSDGEAFGVGEVLEAMESRGLDNILIHVIGFQSDRDNYTPFVDHGAALLTAENATELDDAMTLTFKGILQLEANDQ